MPFKPFVNIAIYKILEFLYNDDANIRKASLNILGLLISFYPNDIKPIKNSIIKLLLILQNDKDDNIRNKAIYIFNKIKNQYSSSYSINPIKRKKYNLYFYDFGYDNWLNNKELNPSKNKNSNITTNKFFHKRIKSRNPSYKALNVNYDNKKSTIKTEPRYSKSDIGEINKFKTIIKNGNGNKKNLAENESIGFRELLNMVKKRSDNKCKIDSNFSNLRDEIKKNNNGILQIRKIKNEKIV